MADKNRYVREAALGWLEIELSGEHTERLLNLALQQGLELRGIRRLGQHRLRARLLLCDLYELRPLLSAAHCRLRIVKRGGRPFWLARARRRWGLIAGSILFALALYMVCSFVWQVKVESIYPLEAAERQRIAALALDAGLQPGAWAPTLDLASVSNSILANASDLVFAYVERRGVTALIHVVRRIDVRDEEIPLPPGDIVATADGLIEQILVRAGTAAVKPGATVKSGDVLVYGFNGGQITAASALIEARIWGEAQGNWPLTERGLRPSGQSESGLRLRFDFPSAANAVLLNGYAQASYTHFAHKEQVYKAYLWRNIPLPVEFILDTWYEQEPYATSYSREQALARAQRQAAGLALEQLPGNCDLLQQRTTELESGENTVLVQVIYEARADIGKFIPLSEERRQLYEQMLAAEYEQDKAKK